MERKDNETYISYIKRVTDYCADKKISYSEWGDYVLGTENNYSSENLRKAFYVCEKIFKNIDIDSCESDETFERLEALKEEIKKERLKTQTCNIERNRIDRQKAREELFYEQVGEYIKKVIPPQLETVHIRHTSNKYILTLADIHYGAEFVTQSNEYSKKIAKDRFEILKGETIRFIKERGLRELTIVGLGDFCKVY